MTNPIQVIRNVYNIEKSVRDNGNYLNDDKITDLLKLTLNDEELISKYPRFKKGYAAEDLFMRIFSLLPWVKNVVPLGQEQFPENSKETTQVPDYEIIFEAGSKTNTSNILIEVKLVDNEKQTLELQNYKYKVLQEYSKQKNTPLLFAIFWRKYWTWTINSIENFSPKKSSYKINFEKAALNDLSAIFGDYTYLFKNKFFRRSIFTTEETTKTDYIHKHKKYGLTIYEGLSLDGKDFKQITNIEPAVLDCAFTLTEIDHKKISDTDTEIIEQPKNLTYIHKLSSLILKYLYKMSCYDTKDMYYENNYLVTKAFDIIDTVRRECGGERFYLIPYDINETATKVFNLQFSNASHILNAYKNVQRTKGYKIIVSHEVPVKY